MTKTFSWRKMSLFSTRESGRKGNPGSASRGRLKLGSVLIFLVLLMGCASSRPHGLSADLQAWVGVWRGTALIENALEAPAEWSLQLTEKNGRLRGFISSNETQFGRIRIEDVKVTGSELYFTFGYETRRGLRAVQRHKAVRYGEKLLSVFDGSEGGRPFRGKWEAHYER